MTDIKTEPPPMALDSGDIPDLQDLLPMLLGQAEFAPNGDDVETYLAMMDETFDDVPESDKRELIHFLLKLCETVIGIQFGIAPEQTALRLGQESSPRQSDSMVSLKPDTHTTFKRVATGHKTLHGKG